MPTDDAPQVIDLGSDITNVKECKSCKLTKSIREFRRGGIRNKKVRYYSICKSCYKPLQRAYQAKTRKRINELQKIRYHKNEKIDYINNIRTNTPCADCKQKFHYSIMEFDHLPQYSKEFEICLYRDYSLEDIEKEMKKCELVCANCHRYRTFIRRKRDK